MSSKLKPSAQKPVDRFVETARELGLDNEEGQAAFERLFGTIAPPKKEGDIAPPHVAKKPKQQK